MHRRTLLARTAALGAVALAGCTGGDEPANETTTDGDDSGTTTTGTTATEEPTTGSETVTGSETATDDGAGTTTTDADGPTEEPTETATPTPDDSPQDAVTVTVGADGRARFSPDSFTLAQGGTVTWEWQASGHNVVPESQPSGANWEGTAGGESETYSSGHTAEETFDTPGEYAYYCSPHRSIGMIGSFTVE